MAQDVLNMIRLAEDRAQEIINNAQAAARETLREIGQLDEQKLAQGMLAIRQKAQADLAKAEKEAAKACETETAVLQTEVDNAKADAEKNIDKASAYILGRIV